jgi:hypothetical protein
MRYRLRTLLIILALVPPVLAGTWVILREGAFVIFLPIGAVLWDWLWDRIEWQRK